jgi:hypothetical protein
VANLRTEYAMRNTHVPVGPWRGVNTNQNGLYLECFMEEVAAAAGRDPLEFRRALMKNHPKHLAVLNAAADKAGWGKPLPAGVHRGIAQFMGYASYTAAVAEVSQRLLDLGCYEVSLGDTVGVGTPGRIRAMLDSVAARIPVTQLAGHYHDTWGMAAANIYASMEAGVATFDSSVAGLGGCPYAKGASGNVATEDVLYLMNGLGIETGIDIDAVAAAGRFICGVLGKVPATRAGLALAAQGGHTA